MKQFECREIDQACCRPSGARGSFGPSTRGLRPGLDAAAPPGLRRAEPDLPLHTHADYCGEANILWGWPPNKGHSGGANAVSIDRSSGKSIGSRRTSWGASRGAPDGQDVRRYTLYQLTDLVLIKCRMLITETAPSYPRL